MRSNQEVEAVIFDLDETLYPRNAGLMQEIGRRISSYMEERLGFGPELTARLRPEYAKRYGTSLRGLQIHHKEILDSEDYLAYVHDIPLAQYIAANPALQEMLRAMPQRKVVFTNSTTEHALAVMRVLGIEDLFEDIIDVRCFDYICKPQIEAYQKVVDRLGVPADRCLLVEDNVRNLIPGKQLGMWTVLVGDHEPDPEAVDFHVPDVLGVADVIRQLNTEHPQQEESSR